MSLILTTLNCEKFIICLLIPTINKKHRFLQLVCKIQKNSTQYNTGSVICQLYNILISCQSCKMRTRALRQTNIREVKCNLCLEWMVTHNLTKNTLNSCSTCLQKYAEGADIWNQKGEKIKLILVKDHQAVSQSFLKNGQGSQELTQPSRVQPLNLSKLQQMMQRSQLSVQQKQILDSRIQYFAKECEQEAQNICQLIRRISHEKSQSSLQYQPYERSLWKHKSQIFESYINQSEIKPNKKYIDYQTLEDYCQNLDQTRYIKGGYEFYFDSEQIQKYSSLSNTKSSTRVFGTELNSILSNQQNLFLDLGRKLQNKSNRSFVNIQPNSVRDLRMTQETLKLKISNCLESKHPSSSLHKILSMNTKEAYVRTKIFPKMIELISFKISSIDLSCYLNLFESENMQTVKLVNVQLNNSHLAIILDNIWNKKIQRLVLSCNKLTDGCLPLFLNKSLPFLKQIYLGKNRINKYRMKQNIVELRSKFVIYI